MDRRELLAQVDDDAHAVHLDLHFIRVDGLFYRAPPALTFTG